ncbi:hypothetical protein ABXS75_14435 [Roseburia hominis]
MLNELHSSLCKHIRSALRPAHALLASRKKIPHSIFDLILQGTSHHFTRGSTPLALALGQGHFVWTVTVSGRAARRSRSEVVFKYTVTGDFQPMISLS